MLSFVRRWMGGLREKARVPRSNVTAGLDIPRPSPTIFHITHWKAGSQWMYKIIRQACARDRLVKPEIGVAHLLEKPIEQGQIYPTCYVSREVFERLALPPVWQRFVVIRDLRDTLVSLYFSMKISHRILVPGQDQRRALLNSLSIEEGLLHALDVGLPGSARIQQSWLEAGEELLHYEDLLLRDEEILVPLLTRKCSLGVSAETVRKAIASCRFEKLTGGRSRGEEDVTSHERKGVAGDWRNHFTERVKREFKARYGDLLIATGYEKDHAW